ncbi:type VII secretion protein EssB [Oceanobacillus sp. FSL K6-0118]|uniref:type VII secretion protein EssB n=1 Tax=Oceanobacillus sp. FSL K6-0118 TaxID=2921418 RepID=UPI0030F783F1
MKEKTMEFENLTLPFVIEEDTWRLSLAKSQTRIKDIQQMRIMTETSDSFVPVKVDEEQDQFRFLFQVDPETKKWSDIDKLARNEKLRLLCNVAELKNYLSTRITFFIHPDNLVFDANLMPKIIYRGIRDLLPPYQMDEQNFHKQLQAFSIALFSCKYSYDQLYHGSLSNANDTEFERQVRATADLTELKKYLQDSYRAEQKKTEKEMQVVPMKRFRLFKRLSIIMIVVSILLVVPLAYMLFVRMPYLDNLLDAQGKYLASDYNGVITTLEGEDPENLPNAVKYILATSSIQVENLADKEKEVIMKNVSLKSNEDYLLYWIYNGRGEFEASLEKAKYLDDPTLIMYGLIKQIEQARNNPDLSGTERDEEITDLQNELEKYREEYIETDEEQEDSDSSGKAQKTNNEDEN